MTEPMTTKPEAPAEAGQTTESPTESIAKQRRAVVEALSSGGALTIQQIERAVGQLLPDASRDPVEESVESLVREGLVKHVPEDARRLRLTERGERFAKGIQALAAG